MQDAQRADNSLHLTVELDSSEQIYQALEAAGVTRGEHQRLNVSTHADGTATVLFVLDGEGPDTVTLHGPPAGRFELTPHETASERLCEAVEPLRRVENCRIGLTFRTTLQVKDGALVSQDGWWRFEDADIQGTLTREELVALVSQGPPAITPAGYTLTHPRITSTPDSRIIHAALSSGEGWQDDPTRIRRIFRQDDSPFLLAVSSDADGETTADQALENAIRQKLREITNRFDALRADIHHILEMHWLEHRQPDGWAVLSLADIMHYRNRSLWRGTVREKDLTIYSEALRDILRPRIEGKSTPVWITDEKGKRTAHTVSYDAPLWHSETVQIQSLPGLGRGWIECVKYRPAEWLRTALQPYAVSLARVATGILELDYYRHARAKAIGWELLTLYRINRGAARITMRSLLRHPDARPTPRETDHPAYLIRSTQDALNRLCNAGVIGSYRCLDDKPLPRYGKLDAWLDRTWLFVPPAEIAEEYAHIERRRQAFRAPKKRPALEAKQEGDAGV